MRPLKNMVAALSALALAATLIGCGSDTEELKLTTKQEQEVAERLSPAGEVALEGEVASVAPAASSSEPRSGQQVYDTKCFTCHASGAAGAPKMGSSSDWSGRLAQGVDALYSNAINGIRGMPPKGLCMDCSGDEISAAVDYMLENSK
ncbi:MAG: c-type cytochrome [Porticoccaceae bacterium]|nr:cytochrome c5 family protein [Pseudomonadales bacterium]MCP5170943.1 cytochrome c5 family protein [Pseudomonadales bacterium]MCP5301817.1 cytochrome c5 family protein [Pseudomonadales bacterium]